MGREGRRRGRLSRSGDFERVFREGHSHGNRYLVLYAFPRPDPSPERPLRLGISVGRKIGNAVQRNRVKRVLREIFWAASEQLPDGHDFVLVARPDIAGLVEREGSAGTRAAVEDAIAGAGLPGPGGEG